MKDDEISGALNTHGRDEKFMHYVIGIPEGNRPYTVYGTKLQAMRL
jgi:hypothetical protein